MKDIDIFEYKQFTIVQANAAMKVGTDGDLLGALAAGGKRILDIGTGTGIISLMMAQRFPDAQITAVEIDDDAVLDADRNFKASPFADRITLVHSSFQDFLQKARADGSLASFDCVVCNPPYFHQSLECGSIGRTRARHTSSLPFPVLIQGAYELLTPEGVFSVCIPPEVYSYFTSECLIEGFWPKDFYNIKSVPDKSPKRYILIHSKNRVEKKEHTFCMLNADRTRSEWYKDITSDFHILGN